MSGFNAHVLGADETARSISDAAKQIKHDTRMLIELIVKDGEAVYRKHAPEESGRLKRNIKGRVRKITEGTIEANPRRRGYAYIGVTRFGHSTSRIYAKGRAMGPFTYKGVRMFRYSVRGYHPLKDWARAPVPEMRVMARGAIIMVGEEFVNRTGR